MPLGLFDEAEYDEFKFRMKPGDMFVFFSDGILDARNRKGELFGRGRVEKIIAECEGKSATCVVDSLFKAVAEHSAGVETFDDQTVVAIRVRGGGTHATPKEKMTSRSQKPAVRPPGFVYRETSAASFAAAGQSVLHCDEVALPKLAEQYGTPLYVYSATMIRERYDAFDDAFRDVPHTICYSVKANSNLTHSANVGAEGLRVRRGFRRRTGTRAHGGRQSGQASCLFRRGQDTRGTDCGVESRNHAVQRRERVGVVGAGRVRRAGYAGLRRWRCA